MASIIKNLTLNYTWDATKKMETISKGSKFLIIEKTLEPCSLASLHAIIIKKVIDNIAGGEVDFCKKQHNGTLLVKTKNEKQAAKIFQLTSFNLDYPVKVSMHRSLNYSLGVIYTNEFRGIPEDEIVEFLRPQGVIQVRKILKKQDNILKETGLCILTFDTNTLPSQLKIGYEIVEIRKYNRPPMQCINCQRFGHTAKWCKASKICINCSNDVHTNQEAKERCQGESFCINCKENNLPCCNHSPRNKSCPMYLKEKEIQGIRNDLGVSRGAAIKIYEKRFPSNADQNIQTTPNASNINNENSNNSNSSNNKKIDDNNYNESRMLVSYSDVLNVTDQENDTMTSKPLPSNIIRATTATKRALRSKIEAKMMLRRRGRM